MIPISWNVINERLITIIILQLDDMFTVLVIAQDILIFRWAADYNANILAFGFTTTTHLFHLCQPSDLKYLCTQITLYPLKLPLQMKLEERTLIVLSLTNVTVRSETRIYCIKREITQ